jgi:hypothetical protein
VVVANLRAIGSAIANGIQRNGRLACGNGWTCRPRGNLRWWCAGFLLLVCVAHATARAFATGLCSRRRPKGF